MNNKNDIDRILYLLGEENVLEELNNSTEVHEFSEKYKKEKMKMIKNHNNIDITTKSNRKGMSRKKIVVLIAAITAALAISATAYGAVKHLFTTSRNEETGTLIYSFEEKSIPSKIPKIKITPEYLPEGYSELRNAQGKYHPKGDTSEPGGITILQSYIPDGAQASYVSSVEDVIFNGLQGQIVTNEGFEYNHTINLFYDGGQIICIMASKEVPLDELKKVAANIKYEVIPGEFIQGPSFFEKVKDFANNFKPETKYTEPSITTENIFNIGEEKNDVDNDTTKPTYTVNSIEVLDKLPELDKSGFSDYNEYLQFINEDGTLKDHERVKEEKWENNKMNTITETVEMKYVYVTLTMKNHLDKEIKDVNIYPRINLLKKISDNTFKALYVYGSELQTDSAPFYFDQSDYEGRLFYFCDFAPKEAKEINLVYAVDEDLINDLYINFDNSGSAESIGNYIKITK